MTMRSFSCVMRLIAPSNTQSKMMLVGRHRKRGLSAGDHVWNASASALPRAVYVTGRGPQPDGGTSFIASCPDSTAAIRLFGTRLPPPLGGTAITYCSCAQSPVMLGSPDGSRFGRVDRSMDVVCSI